MAFIVRFLDSMCRRNNLKLQDSPVKGSIVSYFLNMNCEYFLCCSSTNILHVYDRSLDESRSRKRENELISHK